MCNSPSVIIASESRENINFLGFLWNPLTQYYVNSPIIGKTVLTLGAVTEPFISTSLLSIIVGTALNLLNVPRPGFFKPINTIFVPLISILLLTSIGMALRFSSTKKYIKPALIMIIIKSLIVPAAAVSLGFAFGLHHIANGLPIQVVLILSTMPVGFTALVPPTLYNLDLDLANTNWLFSTASLIITVPILSFLITLF